MGFEVSNVALRLRQDDQVDAGIGQVLDEPQAVQRPPADAVQRRYHHGVAGLEPGQQVLEGLPVAPGARADLGDDLVDAAVPELLLLGLEVAGILGGLADPGEADDEGETVRTHRHHDDFQASTASRDAAALASAYGYALSAAFGVACMPHMR